MFGDNYLDNSMNLSWRRGLVWNTHGTNLISIEERISVANGPRSSTCSSSPNLRSATAPPSPSLPLNGSPSPSPRWWTTCVASARPSLRPGLREATGWSSTARTAPSGRSPTSPHCGSARSSSPWTIRCRAAAWRASLHSSRPPTSSPTRTSLKRLTKPKRGTRG